MKLLITQIYYGHKENQPLRGSDPKGTIYNDVNKIRALFEDAESNSGYWQKTVYKHFPKNIQFFDGEVEIDKQGDDDYIHMPLCVLSIRYLTCTHQGSVRPLSGNKWEGNKIIIQHSTFFCTL